MIHSLLLAKDYTYLAFGFGFVIFFHELGHFLAAKYCDVKVEQFAVGFGPAIFSWRKGMGIRWGSTGTELEDIQRKAGEGAVAPNDLSKYGETEYRLNWIPLGGYVKMLGQDDLRPELIAQDPRAYNNKSIRGRMLIVSAGVIMNVILAAIGFMVVFRMGYPVPPPIVGSVESQSPATQALNSEGAHVALKPGDYILSYDGKDTSGDFGKIVLDVALTEQGATVPLLVRHTDGTKETLRVTPAHVGGDPKGLLALGVIGPVLLRGPDITNRTEWDPAKLKETYPPESLTVEPGDTITQIAGQDAQQDQFWKLTAALDASDGKPLDLTIRTADGKILHRSILPHFQQPFGKEDLAFLGMEPRASVPTIVDKSPALGKLQPGDVIADISVGNDHIAHPTVGQIKQTISQAGEKQEPVSLMVLGLAEDKLRTVAQLVPSAKIGDGKRGLNIGLGYDEQHLIVAHVQRDSSTYEKIPEGATLTAINGKPISNWFQVRDSVANAKAGDTLSIEYIADGGDSKPQTVTIPLSVADIESARGVTLAHLLFLDQMPGTKQSNNPVQDLKWGIIETRDLILQFYLTLQRMTTGAVSARNAMGPVGMFATGAQLAGKGANWLIWFLSMISANLAVVNFLPIPIVDGGLFTLLILEKIQGKPLSPDAQKIVQMVGLALILGVFLLVTYQDIARLVGS
ncbi:MAG: site-2 protease family protein [Planctomycetota bacterium]|nr:site-2 protease family protein [Planctomycetota bacterium]